MVLAALPLEKLAYFRPPWEAMPKRSINVGLKCR